MFKKLLFIGLVLFCSRPAWATRIMDIASLSGVRSNQLIGYSLVVGLDGTGDQTTQTPFTVQSLLNMMGKLGVSLPAGTNMQLKNVAAVMVTANLPAFAQPGQRIDVTVSSIGNASSLVGGTLLMTPLKGADGQIYAMAQGNMVVAGIGAKSGGSSTVVNHLAAGRIPNGATVEKTVPTEFVKNGFIQIELNEDSFITANRVSDAINAFYPLTQPAQAINGRVIEVRAPVNPEQRVNFLAQIDNIPVDPDEGPARIVLDARTGSIVMTRSVSIDKCAIAHGNLTVTIKSTPAVSQPNPFGRGQTVVVQQSQISIKQQKRKLITLKSGAELDDVVRALNALGATPQDLLAILQAMKAAGALHAELEVI
ncbi:MAG: flagellar basal body P-ring protein FlgI [Proteobacteria bacterium]|nr:flagellar basal body P-ring protein FlgI [Pseudomonadota bacterium]